MALAVHRHGRRFPSDGAWPRDRHRDILALEMLVGLDVHNALRLSVMAFPVLPHVDVRVLARTDDVLPILCERSGDLTARVPET